MKKIILIIMLASIVVLSTSAVAANIEMADTPAYNTADGKILLLYGNTIAEVHLTLRDLEESSSGEVYHYTNISENSFMTKMKNPVDAKYVRYDVLAYDTASNAYQFTGVYKTFSDAVDYNMIEQLLNESNAEVQLEMDALKESVEENISGIDNLENNLKTYNSNLIGDLKTNLEDMGLTTSQIEDITMAIEEGYDEVEDNLQYKIAQAEDRGFNSAMSLVGIFLVVIIIGFALWFFTRKDGIPFLTKKKRGAVAEEDDFADIFG